MGNANPAVLKKLDDLLNRQADKSEFRHRLDLTSEQKLMWFDSTSHLCKVPRRSLIKDSPLRTLCGAPVTTTKIALVEDSEFFDPSCPQCFAKNLSGLPDFARARSGAGRLTTSLSTFAMFVIGIYLAPSFSQTFKTVESPVGVLASTSLAEPGHGQKSIHSQSAQRRPVGLEEFRRNSRRG